MTKTLPEAELIEKIRDVHVIGIRSATTLNETVLKEAKELLMVGCFCIGTNQVDLKYALSRGIPVFNSPFSNSRSVAELIIGLIVALARKLGDVSMKMHNGTWFKSADNCHEVRGKTVGIIGYGHVGSQVSVLAESMGMKVLFYDVVPKMPLGSAVSCHTVDDVLRQADFVTLHVPETDTTKNMIGAAQLASMRKGSYLLNYSRGTVVDLDALAAALKSGHLHGAAVDVYPEEPKTKQAPFVTPLMGCPNTILTPHIGGSTEEAQALIGSEVGVKIHRFLSEACSLGAVNFPEVFLERQPGTYRICNTHVNQPGVLKELNRLCEDFNIVAQSLRTHGPIGFVVMDLDSSMAQELKEQIFNMPTSYKTRLLK
jgi:D-3-phosphoglycerate dehydrogenase